MKLLLLALVAVLALTGCSAQPASQAPRSSVAAMPVGSSEQTLTVGGIQRDYRIFVPTPVPANSPLVIMLHGGFGTAQQAEDSYGWDAEAASAHFVVAYPDGLHRAWNVGGGCCGEPGTDNVDDVAFISAVVASIESRMSIDHARVFATGISNGGMMAYRLACDTSIFAAIGPDSATLLGDCPNPHPVSVIHIHGLADQKVRFSGGAGDGYATIDGPPVESVIARFERADGCASAAATTAGVVTTSIASGCADGRAVELITIAGAGHQWPGSAASPLREKLLGADPPSTALDATSTIWAFFAAH
jgi:polyhydroxybutyrate depolymerase